MASIAQYGKSAANLVATATRNGLLAAGDFLRVQAARFYGNQTFLAGMSGTHLSVNADVTEGTGVYNRQDTTAGGALWQFYKDSAYVSYAPAGANPIAFSTGTFQWCEVPTTDANGWARVFQTNGKRKWSKRVTVNSGWPASVSWAPLATVNLPVGVATLAAVKVDKNFIASANAEFMTIEANATTTSTSLIYNGRLAAGPGNWNAFNPALQLDIELTEI